MHHHPAAGDRDVDLAGPRLVGTPRRDAARIDREGHAADDIGVAHGAVHHHAGHATPRCPGHHQLARDRVGQPSLGVHHDHVAGLGHVDRPVQQQVVAGTHPHGEGDPEQRRPVHRADVRIEAEAAVHLVGDVGHRQSAELLHQRRRRPMDAGEDAESDAVCHADLLSIVAYADARACAAISTTCWPMERLPVRPGDSMPKSWMMPATPCARGPLIMKSSAGWPGAWILGRTPA